VTGSTSDEYRVLATKYERLAREAKETLLKQRLEELAEQWRRMAAIQDRRGTMFGPDC
jgi:hypothetical protein